jgi:hypothetical protein
MQDSRARQTGAWVEFEVKVSRGSCSVWATMLRVNVRCLLLCEYQDIGSRMCLGFAW